MSPEDVQRVFRQLYLADLEVGECRSEADYRALFPGHEDAISEQLARFDEVSTRSAIDGERIAAAPIGFSGAPGEKLGRYRIQREIGRGGQAIVYQAEDEGLQRQVALKVLTGLGPGSEGMLARFRREAEIASRLDHPGICTVYEAGVASGVPFIAMQFVDGETLAQRISRRARDTELEIDFEEEAATEGEVELPDRAEITRLVEIFERAARALHAAHEVGITHRDIKPGNIMLQRDGSPVILDFGLARDDDGGHDTITRTGDFFGTPAYMSPEQLLAHRSRLDGRTDVFSLGVALFEALAGRRPFEAASRDGIYQAIITKDPPDLRRLNAVVPKDLKVVVETALEKDRDRRYQSALDFAEELRRVRTFEPIRARPAGALLRVRRWTQRHPGVSAMIALLLLVLAGGSIFAAANTSSELRRAEERRAREEREATERRWNGLVERMGEFADLTRANRFQAALRQADLVQIAVGFDTFGERGLEELERMYGEGDTTAKVVSTQVLGLLSSDASWRTLVKRAMSEENLECAALASQQAVLREHPDLERVCLDLIENGPDDFRIRLNAAFGLCRAGNSLGVEKIRAFYNNPKVDAGYRMQLAASALLLRNETVRPFVNEVVEKILDSESRPATLLLLAVEFYRAMKSPEARRMLERISLDEKIGEENVREQAREALAEYLEEESVGSGE